MANAPLADDRYDAQLALSSEPERSIEIEHTYDVDDDTVVPDWSALAGVARVDGPHLRSLDARYIDTKDAGLARRSVAIRRRTGGPDEGWHLKGPAVNDARVEIRWPLGTTEQTPAEIREAAAEWAEGELLPLARIQNERDAYLLLDEAGAVIAEFVDDHVRATDLRENVERTWREWEFELREAAPAGAVERQELFAAARNIAYAQGARPALSASKLARALGR